VTKKRDKADGRKKRDPANRTPHYRSVMRRGFPPRHNIITLSAESIGRIIILIISLSRRPKCRNNQFAALSAVASDYTKSYASH